jgi:hypothetical protein
LGLLDTTDEHPASKLRRYLITTVVFILLVAFGIWWMLRYHQEKLTVRHFLDAVVAGKMDDAYKMWKPAPSYTYKDFVDDWGPNGYYGPVKSYHYEDAEKPAKSESGVIIVFEVSPDATFPSGGDSKTKEVRVWVAFADQSMSFPP